MVKAIRWWVPQVGREERRLLNKALASNFPNEGKLTTLFEKRVAHLLGSKHAVAVTSGTAALFLSLKALGIGRGDEVVVPDLTFIATANAVEMAGAKVVLVDIDTKTLNLSPEKFSRAITKRTKAVIPVHVSGRPAPMDDIRDIAKRDRIYVIEDAAEAFMSKYKGKYLGTIGNMGCFSFSPHKTITTGQGGMIVTNDDRLCIRLRELKDQGRPTRGTGGDDAHKEIGYNFKFTDLQAAVGLGQLKYLESRVNRLKEIHQRYERGLEGAAGIRLFHFDIEKGELPQWTDALVEHRDELDSYLRARKIDCRRYWFPIHTQVPYKLPDKGFPNSTRLSRQALWLPSAFIMEDSDVDRVCDTIRTFFAR